MKKSKILKDRYFVVAKKDLDWPIKTTKREDHLLGTMYPVGSIVNFCHKKETDAQIEKMGFLSMNGQEYDPKKWPELHKICGKVWKNKVPNMKLNFFS